MHFSWQTGTTLRPSNAPISTHSLQRLRVPSSVGYPSSRGLSFPNGVSSSSCGPLPASLPQWAALHSGVGGGTPMVAPRLFLDHYSEVPPPSRSDSLFDTVLPSHVTLVLLAQGGGTPAPAPVRHGGAPSCPDPVGVNAASSARPAGSLCFGGMASTTANSCSMSVLPRLHTEGTSPTIMGGSSVPPPPTTLATTIMATAALLRIMGGIRLSNFLCQCMGGIKLLLGMYLRLCTVVHPFPRAMGGIPVRLHQLLQAWCLWARCITLLCRWTITIPPLGLTLPCHLPALVEAHLLLSYTIPVKQCQ
jgi:hypothetical protein